MQVRPGRSYFNPRLREGGDPKRYLSHIFFPISIHASAREATLIWSRALRLLPNFNPRLREGGDATQKAFAAHTINFNPRLREGGDKVMYWRTCDTKDFNPRLREGGDPCGAGYRLPVLDFNPRLREGGDCINYQFLHLIQSIPCIDHPSGTSN